MWRKATIALSAASVLALGACSGDSGTGGAADNGDGGTASVVTMRDNTFVPSDPTIAAGEVGLVNDGESPHTFTVEGEGVNAEVDAGQSSVVTVDLAPGTYTLFCEFHRAQGMEGRLTVEG